MIELNKVYNEDCLEGMKRIPNESIDMILCDLPYEKTKNKWDTMIPFKPLWEQYERVIKPTGAIVLFGQDKFTAKLMLSNEKLHRYNLIWDKVMTSGFLNANKMPLRSHEDICVFYKKLPTYNPQKVIGKKNHSRGGQNGVVKNNKNYGDYAHKDNSDELGSLKHPKSILTFAKPHASACIHPTQKSVELCEWLIKTYTNEGETVLDNCMGGFTTAVACIKTNRNYIGYENDKKWFDLGSERVVEHMNSEVL